MAPRESNWTRTTGELPGTRKVCWSADAQVGDEPLTCCSPAETLGGPNEMGTGTTSSGGDCLEARGGRAR